MSSDDNDTVQFAIDAVAAVHALHPQGDADIVYLAERTADIVDAYLHTRDADKQVMKEACILSLVPQGQSLHPDIAGRFCEETQELFYDLRYGARQDAGPHALKTLFQAKAVVRIAETEALCTAIMNDAPDAGHLEQLKNLEQYKRSQLDKTMPDIGADFLQAADLRAHQMLIEEIDLRLRASGRIPAPKKSSSAPN